MLRVKLDLQRIDRALKPLHGLRGSLKSGSVEAWAACSDSLAAVVDALTGSVFTDRDSSAATWIHWRKSGTSKQLLGLLRAVVEEAPGSALVAGCVRERTLHVGIRVISVMFKHTQSKALWPAMREWIVDQGGLQAIWQALTWSMALVGEDQAAHDAALRAPFHAVTSLMSRPDGAHPVLPPSAHPSITSALTLLFSDLLPRDLASTDAHELRMQEFLVHVAYISDVLCFDGCQPLPQQLHRAFIVAWPHFMGWFRRRLGVGMHGMEVENLTVGHLAQLCLRISTTVCKTQHLADCQCRHLTPPCCPHS